MAGGASLYRTWCLGYALAALGTLTKGPQAPVYFVGPVALYLLSTRNWRVAFHRAHLAGVATFAAVLATWHLLLDAGRCQDGERFLAGTAQRPVLRLSAGHAAELGVGTGDAVTVRTDRGQVTLPLVVTPMPDGVGWLPQNSTGSTVRPTLGVDAGAVVRVQPAALAVAANDGEGQ